jgi:hypothetical protein
MFESQRPVDEKPWWEQPEYRWADKKSNSAMSQFGLCQLARGQARRARGLKAKMLERAGSCSCSPGGSGGLHPTVTISGTGKEFVNALPQSALLNLTG